MNKVLERIKEIKCTEKVGDTKILIDTDDTFSDDITLKNIGILIICIIKDIGKFYSQIFLEEVLVA